MTERERWTLDPDVEQELADDDKALTELGGEELPEPVEVRPDKERTDDV